MTTPAERRTVGPRRWGSCPPARPWAWLVLAPVVISSLLLIAGAQPTQADPGRAIPSAGGEHHPASHDEIASPPLARQGPAGGAAAAVAALGVWGVTAVARRWRRATVAALVLLVGSFTVETGAHAAHHLADPEKASSCAASWASQHIEGTGEDAPDIRPPVTALGAPAPACPDGHHPLSTRVLPEGRAPPRPSAA